LLVAIVCSEEEQEENLKEVTEGMARAIVHS
jgi:hypothetical protein